MDNPNINPLAPQTPSPQPKQEAKFPSFEAMQKLQKKHQISHITYAVIAILVVGMGVLWYFFKSEVEFAPTQINVQQNRQGGNEVGEVDNINIGDLDSEFQSIDSDLNSL